LGLFTKIFLAISLVMGVFFYFVVNYIIAAQENELISKLKTNILHNTTKHIPSITHAVYEMDKDFALTTLKTLYLDQEVTQIVLSDESSNVIINLNTKTSIDKDLIISNSTLIQDSFELGTLYISYSKDLINKEIKERKSNILKFSISLYLILLTSIFYIIYPFAKSIKKLIDITTKISVGNFDSNIDIRGNDEIGLLANKFKLMQKSIKNQQFLIQQHKLSQLGQLLGFISHEWKEPLNRISSYIVSIQIKNTNQHLASKLNKCQHQIDHMCSIMSSFKSFYMPNSNKDTFYFDEAIHYILELLKNDFLMNNIYISYENNNKKEIMGNQSEFSQIILILLNNSKEAFLSKEISKKEISIIIKDSVIVYSDTAEGVNESDLKNLFLPEFSTKEGSMGIGLYMLKLIVKEKFNASIEARNCKKGLCFTIVLNDKGNIHEKN